MTNTDVQAEADATAAVTPPAVPGGTEPDEFEGGLIPSVSTAEAAAQAEETASAAAEAATARSQKDATIKELAAKLGIKNADALSSLLAQATGALTAEVQALRAELQTVQSSQRSAGADGMFGDDASIGGYPWQLWKFGARFPDKTRVGWVTISPGGATPKGNRDAGSYTRMLQKGLLPLQKYGPCPVPTTSRGADVFLDFFRRFPSFAAEFPASQVVAYNWHVIPPLRGLRFPKYEAISKTVKNYVCEACGVPRYFMPGDRTTGPAYLTHLTSQHKYPWKDAADSVRHAEDVDGNPVQLRVAAFRPASLEEMTSQKAPSEAEAE